MLASESLHCILLKNTTGPCLHSHDWNSFRICIQASYCLCLLLSSQTLSRGDLCKILVVSSVQHCANITWKLQTTSVNAYVQTAGNFCSLYSAAMWACTSLSDMWTVQNLFWAFLSSGFIHGNARHFITSNLKIFVVTRTEKQKPKA